MNYLNTVRMGLGTALTLAFLSTSTTAFAGFDNVGDRVIPQMCPEQIGGDTEYDGHGPMVDTRIDLIRFGEREMYITVDMHQIETVSDWSEAQLTRQVHLKTLPSKPLEYYMQNAEGDWGWKKIPSTPGIDWVTHHFTDTNHSLLTVYNPDWWIRTLKINGDTGGSDIGNCTTDDAYITVHLNTIRVKY